jgi:catechol-2,3-dioxygenase
MAIDDCEITVLSPKKLAHVVLRTQSIAPMVDFYKSFLGAHATYENSKVAFLTYDDEHHRIAIAEIPATTPKVPSAAGLEHIAFTYDNLEELVVSYSQRKKLGLRPVWCVNHGTSTSMYYHDPDGNKVEVQVDNFDNPDDATAFMMSQDFSDNPMGVDFVPEDLIKRLEAGESHQSIKKRPMIGKREWPDNL